MWAVLLDQRLSKFQLAYPRAVAVKPVGRPAALWREVQLDIAVSLGWQGERASLAAWKAIDGCGDTLAATQLPGSRDETYAQCSGGVTAGLITVANGPHDLYSADTKGQLGVTPPEGKVDIASYIWTHIFRP